MKKTLVLENVDGQTVFGFGRGWARFAERNESDVDRMFHTYFANFPPLQKHWIGFDAGCGSGHWASRISRQVKTLHCVDASEEVVRVATELLAGTNCKIHHASVSHMPMADESMDFGYSIGVLHHTPDTAGGLNACVRKLKPGAPFALYLYYRFENRPWWFRAIWKASDFARRAIYRMPFFLRARTCELIAATVYWPLAKIAKIGSSFTNVDGWPLSIYRDLSFYSMRGGALDRFGTKLEQRFTKDEMRTMMEAAGLTRITFNEGAPYWVAVGFKASTR